RDRRRWPLRRFRQPGAVHTRRCLPGRRLQPRAGRRPVPHRLLVRRRLGAFPALTSWWVNTLSLESADQVAAGVLVAVACFGLSVAQRRLSTPVRELRRRTSSVSGEQRLDDGTSIPISVERIAAPLDGALRALSWALVVLAVGLVTLRL